MGRQAMYASHKQTIAYRQFTHYHNPVISVY